MSLPGVSNFRIHDLLPRQAIVPLPSLPAPAPMPRDRFIASPVPNELADLQREIDELALRLDSQLSAYRYNHPVPQPRYERPLPAPVPNYEPVRPLPQRPSRPAPAPITHKPAPKPAPAPAPKPKPEAPRLDMPGVRAGAHLALAQGTTLRGHDVTGTGRVNRFDGKSFDLTLDVSAANGFVKMKIGLQGAMKPDGKLHLSAQQQGGQQLFEEDFTVVSNQRGNLVLRGPNGSTASLKTDGRGGFTLAHGNDVVRLASV